MKHKFSLLVHVTSGASWGSSTLSSDPEKPSLHVLLLILWPFMPGFSRETRWRLEFATSGVTWERLFQVVWDCILELPRIRWGNFGL